MLARIRQVILVQFPRISIFNVLFIGIQSQTTVPVQSSRKSSKTVVSVSKDSLGKETNHTIPKTILKIHHFKIGYKEFVCVLLTKKSSMEVANAKKASYESTELVCVLNSSTWMIMRNACVILALYVMPNPNACVHNTSKLMMKETVSASQDSFEIQLPVIVFVLPTSTTKMATAFAMMVLLGIIVQFVSVQNMRNWSVKIAFACQDLNEWKDVVSVQPMKYWSMIRLVYVKKVSLDTKMVLAFVLRMKNCCLINVSTFHF